MTKKPSRLKTGLHLSSWHRDEDNRREITVYDLCDMGSTTTLDLEVEVVRSFSRIHVSMPNLVVTLEGDDQEKALDRLASWLERAAAVLQKRKQLSGIPIYTSDE